MSDMGIISLWIKDIVILFTIISIVELLMPKGNMKKYIELVVGILIMFTIISPFAKLMNYDFKLDDSLYNYTKKQEEKIENDDDFYMSHEEGVKSLVIEKMKGEIAHIVKKNTDYSLLDIDVDLDIGENSEEINYISIILSEKKKVERDISIEKISPIEIDRSLKDKEMETEKSTSAKFSGLRNEIADKFSIDNEIIKIKLKD